MIAPRHQHRNTWEMIPTLVPAARPGARCLLEIGPGRGDYLRHLAATHPDAHVIGVELCLSRFEKLRVTCTAPNISLVCADAREALPILSRTTALQAIHILFPDPWPKRKHAAHRIMQPAFVALCARSLAPHGTLTFVTDDPDYAKSTSRVLAAEAQLVNALAEPMLVNPTELFPTYFARKWQRAGRAIYLMRYVVVPTSARPYVPTSKSIRHLPLKDIRTSAQ